MIPRTDWATRTLTLASLPVEYFASSALLVVLIRALAFARSLVENFRFGARNCWRRTLALARIVVENLRWVAVAFRLADTPTAGIAECFSRLALTWLLANTTAEVGVEGERCVACLSLSTGARTGLLVESKRSWTRVLVQTTLTLAESGIEQVAQRTLLVGTLALAASSAEVLPGRAGCHLAALSVGLCQLNTTYRHSVTYTVDIYNSNGV